MLLFIQILLLVSLGFTICSDERLWSFRESGSEGEEHLRRMRENLSRVRRHRSVDLTLPYEIRGSIDSERTSTSLSTSTSTSTSISTSPIMASFTFTPQSPAQLTESSPSSTHANRPGEQCASKLKTKIRSIFLRSDSKEKKRDEDKFAGPLEEIASQQHILRILTRVRAIYLLHLEWTRKEYNEAYSGLFLAGLLSSNGQEKDIPEFEDKERVSEEDEEENARKLSFEVHLMSRGIRMISRIIKCQETALKTLFKCRDDLRHDIVRQASTGKASPGSWGEIRDSDSVYPASRHPHRFLLREMQEQSTLISDFRYLAAMIDIDRAIRERIKILSVEFGLEEEVESRVLEHFDSSIGLSLVRIAMKRMIVCHDLHALQKIIEDSPIGRRKADVRAFLRTKSLEILPYYNVRLERSMGTLMNHITRLDIQDLFPDMARRESTRRSKSSSRRAKRFEINVDMNTTREFKSDQ